MAMTLDEHIRDAMRYVDNEMNEQERRDFEVHLAECGRCREAVAELTEMKEVTRDMKLADLPERIWDTYWEGIYNRIERSVAWFLFILGAVILTGYSLWLFIVDPGIETAVRLGVVLMMAGFAVLLLSVLREKLTVNRHDRYISEVKR